jgi:hypothetical protein
MSFRDLHARLTTATQRRAVSFRELHARLTTATQRRAVSFRELHARLTTTQGHAASFQTCTIAPHDRRGARA